MSHETFKAPELDQLAKLLPAYEFESFIAQGGMGAVYKARQRSLDREVAIKILPRELGANPIFRESFQTEAKAMARLNHPNLLGIYDFGDVDGMPYIVMEFVGGKSLYHSAWNKVVEAEQAVEIVKGICDGLGHAHEHGILHRDIKPANILLTPKVRPKIGDFGLAQQIDVARSGAIMGTPGYAAPELTKAPETAGTGADIYAVGVILHELITGQRPDPTGAEPPRPYGDRGIDAIWQKATDPVIANRYATAEEMSAALAAWKPTTRRLNTTGKPAVSAGPRQLVVPATTSSLPRHPAQKPETARPARPPAHPTPVPVSGNWSLARNLLIIAFLIAAIGLGFKMLQRAKKNTDPNPPEKEAVPTTSTTGSDASPGAPKPTNNASSLAESPGSEDPPPIEQDESPSESLARLREQLAAGKREEMPPGSQRLGNNDFLAVNLPMTWYAAQAFAEDHGAHLAIPNSMDDLSWLSRLVTGDQTIWLGSGRSEKSVWHNNDGSDWALEDMPKGVGPFASLNNFGILRAGKANESKPFIMQWHRDGSNPATLTTVLERTRDTYDSPNPIFPPGTVSLETRHILFVPLAVKRSQAETLASKAGGSLAVPASREEISWIASESRSIPASPGYWLGGQRKDGAWTWDSGEVWDQSDWMEDKQPSDPGDALILIPGKGWSIADGSQATAGFAIEWSNDAR